MDKVQRHKHLFQCGSLNQFWTKPLFLPEETEFFNYPQYPYRIRQVQPPGSTNLPRKRPVQLNNSCPLTSQNNSSSFQNGYLTQVNTYPLTKQPTQTINSCKAPAIDSQLHKQNIYPINSGGLRQVETGCNPPRKQPVQLNNNYPLTYQNNCPSFKNGYLTQVNIYPLSKQPTQIVNSCNAPSMYSKSDSQLNNQNIYSLNGSGLRQNKTEPLFLPNDIDSIKYSTFPFPSENNLKSQIKPPFYCEKIDERKESTNCKSIKNAVKDQQLVKIIPSKNVYEEKESDTKNCELDIIEQAFKEAGIDLSEYEEMYDKLFDNN